MVSEALTTRARRIKGNADAIFDWVASSDPRREHSLCRPADIKLRIGHITDMHVPSEVQLLERLRDFTTNDSLTDFAYKISAFSNAFLHEYSDARELYTMILRKTLLGMRRAGVDHLSITGDLAHCGLETEFLEMQSILRMTGWWDSGQMSVVPGNHDRFNLYERFAREPMETFFDVPSSRKPRFRELPGGVVLFEVDSNADRIDDRHFMEELFPNTVGRIYPEELAFFEAQKEKWAGYRVITLMHHHLSDDWYDIGAETILGSLMGPVDGAATLMEATEIIDPNAVFLHGHKHDLMVPDYTIGSHQVSCPGGFAETLAVNFVDVTVNDEIVITQARVRV